VALGNPDPIYHQSAKTNPKNSHYNALLLKTQTTTAEILTAPIITMTAKFAAHQQAHTHHNMQSMCTEAITTSLVATLFSSKRILYWVMAVGVISEAVM